VGGGDHWLTPSLAQCGVRGVMRDYLPLHHLRAQGEQVEEGGAVDYAQLTTAAESYSAVTVLLWRLADHWRI